MPEISYSTELEAVASRDHAQQARFNSKRSNSVALAAFGVVLAIVLLAIGLWVFAVSALFLALIGLSNYFAANGHLHHLQKRERYHRRLARDFSKLRPDGPSHRGSLEPNPSGQPSR